MSFPHDEHRADPTPTQPLTQPVRLPADDAALEEQPTEVIQAPGPWTETAHDVRSWSSSALAGLRKHRAFETRQQAITTLTLALMVCAAIAMFIVAALSPDGGNEPARSLPVVHIS